MKKNYLIFTPLLETWPANLKSTISIVSESAILDLNGKQNEYENFYLNSPRWKNKKIFGQDFRKLSSLFETILKFFSKELNKVHNVNHDYKTWRIILGPWLSMFIFIFFERFSNVEKTFQNKKIDKCLFLDLDKRLFVPYDAREFVDFAQEDYWNQFLYQKIAQQFLDEKKIIIKKNQKNYQFIKYSEKLKKKYTGQKFSKFINFLIYILNLFNRKKYKFFIYGNNFRLKDQFNLAFKLRQLPMIRAQIKEKINRKINDKLRESFRKKIKFRNKFDNICFNSICDFLPTLFLENYKDFNLYEKKANLPTKPKVVFISTALWFQTKVMFFIAKLIKNKKTKFIYSQHGGTYGLSKYNWAEKFEISVADIYLSWGWKNKINKNIKRFFIFKNIKRENRVKKNLLMVLNNRTRYFISTDSSFGTEIYSNYISNVTGFLNNLDKSIKENTILRMPPSSKEKNNFSENLKKNFEFSNTQSFSKACNNSKLIVHTYNSTPFLETISSNLPTILILKKNDNPFKNEAKPFIKNLVKNKILFYDAKLAAKFVNKLWNENIDDWWNDNKTQKAINKFITNYANTTNNISEEIKKIIIN